MTVYFNSCPERWCEEIVQIIYIYSVYGCKGGGGEDFYIKYLREKSCFSLLISTNKKYEELETFDEFRILGAAVAQALLPLWDKFSMPKGRA